MKIEGNDETGFERENGVTKRERRWQSITLTAGTVLETSTDTSGPITTIMRKQRLLHLTVSRPGLLINNRLDRVVVVATVVAAVSSERRTP